MIRRMLDALYDAAGWLAAAFVLALFVVMIGASAMRVLGLRTGGSDDIVAWFCAAAGFLAMAHTFRRADFVRVTLLVERFAGAAVAPSKSSRSPSRPSSSPISPGLPRSSSTRAGISTTWRTG
jgi:hypothetical protein